MLKEDRVEREKKKGLRKSVIFDTALAYTGCSVITLKLTFCDCMQKKVTFKNFNLANTDYKLEIFSILKFLPDLGLHFSTTSLSVSWLKFSSI